MTKEQFDRESRYGALMALSRELVSAGLLSSADFDVINKMVADIYPSMIAKLGRIPLDTMATLSEHSDAP